MDSSEVLSINKDNAIDKDSTSDSRSTFPVLCETLSLRRKVNFLH